MWELKQKWGQINAVVGQMIFFPIVVKDISGPQSSVLQAAERMPRAADRTFNQAAEATKSRVLAKRKREFLMLWFECRPASQFRGVKSPKPSILFRGHGAS